MPIRFAFLCRALRALERFVVFYNDEVETLTPWLCTFGLGVSTQIKGKCDAKEGVVSRGPLELELLTGDCKSTALFELYPIIVACLSWGKYWCRKRIILSCDNEATVNIINNCRSSVALINK